MQGMLRAERQPLEGLHPPAHPPARNHGRIAPPAEPPQCRAQEREHDGYAQILLSEFHPPRPSGTWFETAPTLNVVAEVGDPYPQGVFDHHNLTGAAEHASDVDVDILAGGARSADDAPFLKRQHFARWNRTPVQLHFDYDRDLAQRSNLFLRIHRRFNGLS